MLEAPAAGLTKQEVEFLRVNDPKTWKPGEPGGLGLPECKLKAIVFLASGAFSDDERFLPALCASGSTDSRITAVADDIIKRCRLDLESQDLVQGLYELHGYVAFIVCPSLIPATRHLLGPSGQAQCGLVLPVLLKSWVDRGGGPWQDGSARRYWSSDCLLTALQEITDRAQGSGAEDTDQIGHGLPHGRPGCTGCPRRLRFDVRGTTHCDRYGCTAAAQGFDGVSVLDSKE